MTADAALRETSTIASSRRGTTPERSPDHTRAAVFTNISNISTALSGSRLTTRHCNADGLLGLLLVVQTGIMLPTTCSHCRRHSQTAISCQQPQPFLSSRIHVGRQLWWNPEGWLQHRRRFRNVFCDESALSRTRFWKMLGLGNTFRGISCLPRRTYLGIRSGSMLARTKRKSWSSHDVVGRGRVPNKRSQTRTAARVVTIAASGIRR